MYQSLILMEKIAWWSGTMAIIFVLMLAVQFELLGVHDMALILVSVMIGFVGMCRVVQQKMVTYKKEMIHFSLERLEQKIRKMVHFSSSTPRSLY